MQEHRDDFGSEYEAIKAIAGRLGMNPETVRKWLRQAEVEAGQVDGTTTAAAREIRELKRRRVRRVGPQHRSSVLSSPRSCSGRGRADLPRAESAWLPDRPENLLSLHGPAGRRRNETCGTSSRDVGQLLRARRASACAAQRVLLPALLPALNLARHDAI